MAGEEWARQILKKELGREDVVLNDDGSIPGMNDLRIGSADAPAMAIECVGAVNPIFTETWNIGPAQGSLQLSIIGDWYVVITKETRVKKVKQRIEKVLQELENRGIHDIRANHLLKRYDEELFNKLELLDIIHAYCFRLQGAGEVHLIMSGRGGAVDIQGTIVPEWVGNFLRSPQQSDVLDKLKRSGAPECHVFIPVVPHGAPWSVESYLLGNIELLPVSEPNLPSPVTGVWIAPQFGTQGVCWDSAGWRLFQTRDELKRD
jgi:hypothetical protein